LVLNKIEVVYYASTTFLHTKFIIVDGKRASVSSINFSQASFVRNREAGAIIEGTNAGPFMAFLQSVYEDDWARGIPLQPNATQWNHTQMATILNTSKIDVVLPTPGSTWKEYYVTPVPKPITASARFMLATAPDYAMETLSTFLGEVGNDGINMLQQALIQLDGYDRFEVRDAGYFRLVQPYQYHTNVPTDTFIYCYSFAIRPEELQPSGSLNASRIDSMNLQIALRTDPPAGTTPNLPNGHPNPRYVPKRGNSHIRVYTTNHNILRIVNGFGGLLFKI